MYSRVATLSIVLFAVVVVTFAQFGCATTGKTGAGAASDEVALCADCGQIKGDAKCCQAGAATCEKCKLAKGSPGCCNMKKGQQASLCAKCGQIKGNAQCCKPGQETCAKCNLAKGSPGCCKIKKAG